MNSNQMKNMIVLKDLPSNLIDEAFVILKNNKKIKSIKANDKKNNKVEMENSREYIVKEAEMVISNYLSKMEKEKEFKSYSMKKMEMKYKRLKKLTAILSAIVVIDVILEIVGL